MNWRENLLYPVLGSLLKAFLWPIGRMRLPQVKGTLTIPGLEAPVEILRDRWGAAHLYAQNARDVIFAQGFVHAQERLWQMDFTRRLVFGHLGEVLGKAALTTDRAMRTLSLYETAEQEARSISGEMADLLEAYSAGVNAWIDVAIDRKKLPIEFMLLGYKPERWQIAHSLGWQKLMCWTLAANWQSEFYRSKLIQQLGPEKTNELEIDIDKSWAVILDLGQALAAHKSTDETNVLTGARVGEGVGSNNWAVHGNRSATGKPLLANDMHLELTAPGVWFENHLVGGEFNVTGVTMPGVPFIVAGHNQTIAWGFTDGCPDTQDLYEEHLRETENGSWEYEFKGEWLPATVREEEIQIKGSKNVTEEVIVTRHGSIINMLFKEAFPDSPPLALRWTALEPSQAIKGIHDMNLAGDCLAFRESLRHFDDPPQNIVYADTQGNIGYSLNGRIPIRAKGDGSVPAPGWTGEYEWNGYVPFEAMPYLINPPRGYIVTANNQVQRPDYPYFLGKDYLVSDRAGWIIEMLEAREKIDIPYIKEMQFDQISLSARKFSTILGNLHTVDKELGEIVSKIADWDGKLDAGSSYASVFEATMRQAIRLMLKRHLFELGLRIQGEGPFSGQWPDHTWEWFVNLLDEPESPWFDLGNGEKRDDVLRLALRQAVDFLKQEFGPNMPEWNWGRLHKLTFGHVLGRQKPLDYIFNIGNFAIGGDGTTIWSAYTSWHELKKQPVVGPPFRFIADLGDLDYCWGLLVPGQSGHPASSHYRDGIRAWFEGNYHPMLFQRNEVEKYLEAKMMLGPKAN